jgi:hypothetical protein
MDDDLYPWAVVDGLQKRLTDCEMLQHVTQTFFILSRLGSSSQLLVNFAEINEYFRCEFRQWYLKIQFCYSAKVYSIT